MKNKQGISLIVLVITIIVMIILAAAIILSLNNAGIIGNANKAVDDSNIANIKSAADLAYAEYLIDKPEGITDLGKYLTQKLIDNNTITGDDYIIGICDNETVVAKSGTVAYEYYKGTIKRGDYVNYDPTKGVDINSVNYTSPLEKNGYAAQEFTLAGSYDLEKSWQVMGINKEGQLLLLAEDVVLPISNGITDSNGKQYYAWSAKTDYSVYFEGINELDNISALFGKGYGAVGARSITVEDVNKITGYNPEKPGDGKVHRQGEIGEYGSEVTYSWYKENGVIYLLSEGTNKISFKREVASFSKFRYFENDKTPIMSMKPDNLEEGQKIKIFTKRNESYLYYIDTLVNKSVSEGATVKSTMTENEYNMLYDETSYWLGVLVNASTMGDCLVGGLCVTKDHVEGLSMAWGLQGSKDWGCGVRPVVTLKSDIVLTGSSSEGWTIQ